MTKPSEKNANSGTRWRLSDAKARFSEVVKRARERPQRVSVDGEDAVVIMSSKLFDKEHPRKTGEDLIKAFASPALADVRIERMPITGFHRDVEL